MMPVSSLSGPEGNILASGLDVSQILWCDHNQGLKWKLEQKLGRTFIISIFVNPSAFFLFWHKIWNRLLCGFPFHVAPAHGKFYLHLWKNQQWSWREQCTKNGLNQLKEGHTWRNEHCDDYAEQESIWRVVLFLLAGLLHAGAGTSSLPASLFSSQPLLLKLCQCKIKTAVTTPPIPAMAQPVAQTVIYRKTKQHRRKEVQSSRWQFYAATPSKTVKIPFISLLAQWMLQIG